MFQYRNYRHHASVKTQDVFISSKNQSDFDKAFEGVENLVIDCTEIAENQEKQWIYYSGKKRHTITTYH